MDDLLRMFIEHECRKLATIYCYTLDHGDADGFANIYTEDAMYKPAAESQPMHGRETIREWASKYPSNRLVRHLSLNALVEVIDEDTATGTSCAVVFRDPNPQAGSISSLITPRSLVDYFDTYQRTPDGWRISERYYQIKFMQESETRRPLPWSP